MEQENGQVFTRNEVKTQKLPSFIDLIKESINVYKSNWKILIKIELLLWAINFGIGVAAVILPLIFHYYTSMPLPAAAAATLFLVAIAGLIWLMVLLTIGIIIVLQDKQDNPRISDIIKKATPYGVPSVWAGILSSMVVFAGMVMFIIPGFIFAIWFVFWQYTLVIDNERGLAALEKSRNYIKGYFGDVFILFALGTMTIFFATIAIDKLKILPAGDILTIAASIAIAPVYSIFYYLIFTHLKRLRKAEAAVLAPRSQNSLTKGLAIAGLIAVITIIAAAVYLAPQVKDWITAEMKNYETQNGELSLPPDQKPL